MKKFYYIISLSLILVGCGGYQNTRPPKPPAPPENGQTQNPTTSGNQSQTNGSTKSGGYYLDDGPEANPPSNLDEVPDAVPKVEAINPNNSKPYVALGETYTPMKEVQPYKQRGVASWYGKRFNGKKTASGELYDMYAMTAAHPTLPIPSYVKVTNLKNNRSVIVRVNDRGPFKHTRIIDLSYAAAHKLRMLSQGSTQVEVEVVTPETYNNENSTITSTEITNTEGGTNLSPANLTNTSNFESNSSQFFVQAGAFKFETNANSLRQRILNLGITTQDNINKVYNDSLYRLKLGPFDSESKANQIAAEIRRQLDISSIIHHQ
jgi:rare lipoprotein A